MNDGQTIGRPAPGRGTTNLLAAEQLQELRTLRQTMTELAAQLAGRATNNILEVATAVFPAEGYIALEYNVAAGCIEVNPLGVNGVTVVSAGAGPVVPLIGRGVFVVRGSAGTVVPPQTVPVASRQITLYGTAGDYVSYIVFTSAVEPSS